MTNRVLAIAGIVTAVMLGAAGAMAEGPAGSRVPVPPVKPESYPVASDVRVGGDANQTRFVMDFDRPVDLAAFTLADPYRVVIDLPQVVFKLHGAGDKGRGLVKAFRYGLIMRGGSRIVIDTTGPVHVDKAFVVDPAEGEPARMVIDLSSVDRETFLHNMSAQEQSMHIKAARTSVSTEPDTGSDPRPLIVIDPGHGGIDSGTKSYNGKYDEKDIVLAFGLALRDKLLKSGRYRVAMTRTDDTFIPLTERTRFARVRKASLFISIHADSLPRREGLADGASVYTLSEHASDAEAARLAETENKSDVIAGVDLSAEPNDVANILIDLAQRETKVFSQQFARTLVSDLKPTTRLHLHPVKSAGFIVLKSPDVPSVLVELGYMSTKSDLQNLLSPAWRLRTADSMVEAVDAFFAPRLAGDGSVVK